jgi:hypothetical protein
MIKILFPPGCYGHYLTSCVYHYTNLSPTFSGIKFDGNGSSHAIRKNINSIKCGHYESPGHISTVDSNDMFVTILPDTLHYLDYYNNQFIKQDKGAIIEYVLTQLSLKEINDKLVNNWGYNGKFNNKVPRWILREWFSFWIKQCWHDGYQTAQYLKVPAVIQITTEDIFKNFINSIESVVTALNLNLKVSIDHIQNYHNLFLEKQKFYGSQMACEKWTNCVIDGKMDVASPCKTIFDESYIQHLLRNSNFEIKCDGLNVFPDSSLELHNIIYKT